MGEDDAFGTHLNAPIGHLVDIHVFADKPTCQIVDLQADALAVVLQRQILRGIAFVAQAEDFCELIRLDVQGAIQIVGLGRSLCKLDVVALNEARQKRVAVFHVGDARDPQFLD